MPLCIHLQIGDHSQLWTLQRHSLWITLKGVYERGLAFVKVTLRPKLRPDKLVNTIHDDSQFLGSINWEAEED